MDNQLVHANTDGTLTTTSEIIAGGVGIQHKNVLETIRKNQADFEEFGPIAFETRKGAALPQGGYGKSTNIAVLNREQAMFAMTLFRNTPVVVDFKKTLIKAFVAMENQLVQAEHQINALMRQSQVQMELCQAAKGLIHPDHVEAKALYTLEKGSEPKKYDLTLPNGQVRQVNGYTEADRPLMQRVWDQYYTTA